jgi:hypothetical protein
MSLNFFPTISLVVGDSTTHSTLSRGESIGLAFDTEAGLMSSIAALVVIILMIVSFDTIGTMFIF